MLNFTPYTYVFYCITATPSAPGKPEISDIDATKMTVTWTPPESDGGTPIIGYSLERKDIKGTRWAPVNKDLVKETTLTDTKLTERSEYVYRVTAENRVGPGPASEPSDVRMAKPPYGKRTLFHLVKSYRI